MAGSFRLNHLDRRNCRMEIRFGKNTVYVGSLPFFTSPSFESSIYDIALGKLAIPILSSSFNLTPIYFSNASTLSSSLLISTSC